MADIASVQGPDQPVPTVPTEAVSPPVQAIKPGWKTTEFWGKNIVHLITIGAAAYSIYSGHQMTAEQQAKIVLAATAILGWVESKYSESRGLSKGGS